MTVICFRSDLSDEPTDSDSGSDYSDQQRRSSRYCKLFTHRSGTYVLEFLVVMYYIESTKAVTVQI